jgi:itaconate CoA-transferase
MRSKSGPGCEVHVLMFDVMADWLTVPLLHQEAGNAPGRIGLAYPSIAPSNLSRSSCSLQKSVCLKVFL